MTETGVPYQAGEAPAEKSLGQVSFAALCGVLVDQGWSATALDSWEALDPRGRQEHEAIARAVEAEVLRRVGALLDHCQNTCAPTHDPQWRAGYLSALGDARWCIGEVQEYARQQGEER